MSNSGSLLSTIAGYEDGLARKVQRERSGSDFSEQKGKNAADIAKLHPKRLHLKVVELVQETPSTLTLRLQSKDGLLPPFQAGQYINLFVRIDGVETTRPYAISSCPTQRSYYDLTVKLAEGGFVTPYLLGEVQVGDEYTSTSPMGTFYYNPVIHGRKLVFLAGGSGGAPARAMIESILNRAVAAEFFMLYGNSFARDVIFEQHFRELASRHANFHLTEIISRPEDSYQGLTGYLSAQQIEAAIGGAEDAMFYVCGPTPFNDYCREQLHRLGVKAKRIRIECNGPPKIPAAMPVWPQDLDPEKEVTVTVKGRGTFKAKAGEPLLNSLERQGYSVENACRSGECSLCRVKVLQGQVINAPETRLRKSDRQFGWIHACVAYPASDIEILY